MAEVRMSLQEAGDLLGIASNSVRSRFKAGKIRGERDNAGKIWVWVDPDHANDRGSIEPISKPSIEGSKPFEISALEAHVKTLGEQLAIANAELATLRPKAEAAVRLEAENLGLQAQLAIRAEQLDELRKMLADAKTAHADELRRFLEAPRVKSFFARLIGR